MTFRPALTDAISRVRLFIGDTGETPLLPGGVATYRALAAQHTGDEAAFAQAAAQALRAALALQPSALSDSGSTITWGNRLKHLDAVISGRTPYPYVEAGAGASASSGAFSAAPARNDGYSRE